MGSPDNGHLFSSYGTGCVGFSMCSEMFNLLSHWKVKSLWYIAQTKVLPLFNIERYSCMVCVVSYVSIEIH